MEISCSCVRFGQRKAIFRNLARFHWLFLQSVVNYRKAREDVSHMIVYHGSNLEVQKPILIPSKRLLDFGAGFYVTSDYEQAKKWAVRTANNRETGTPIISVYSFEQLKLEQLKLLKFDQPDRDWLRYIAANRTGKAEADAYDVVFGPVANDQAIRTVNNYLKGYFPEDIAIQLLLPQRLKDQYAFRTDEALSILQFMEARTL